MLARLGIGLLWLLHFLPWPALSAVGRTLGRLGYFLAGSRRRIALTNLRLCFPELPAAQRTALCKSHFRALGVVLMGQGIAFWGSQARLQALVPLEGGEYWRALRGTPVIVLVPHFVGLDVGGIRLSILSPACTIYRAQTSPRVDALLRKSRARFNAIKLLSRSDGIRGIVSAVKAGVPLYYLPDQDFGARDAVFVPFFGVSAATVTGLSRLTRLTGARVLPVVTRLVDGGRSLRTTIYPPWRDFPGESVEADTRRMNAFIEERVREIPEQYLWLHRRFKTRPPGQPGVY
jgi:KDO2-lipid IV(A) lauroyltransferase